MAAHELGHIILHRQVPKTAPMKDVSLYDMINSTEYEANQFAAELPIEDDDVERLTQETDLDFFCVCNRNPHGIIPHAGHITARR